MNAFKSVMLSATNSKQYTFRELPGMKVDDGSFVIVPVGTNNNMTIGRVIGNSSEVSPKYEYKYIIAVIDLQPWLTAKAAREAKRSKNASL